MAKLVALLLAALVTSLLLWLGGTLARPALAWLGQLSRNQVLIFRSICLFIPILAALWITLRQRKPRSSKAELRRDDDFTVE
ncbi:hypothetical protein [Chitinimonas sp.]|uniref:hypothetical protein n=1 Tax=Chitinimonas sp. TaxID=1934313 RepID=UPI002F93C868